MQLTVFTAATLLPLLAHAINDVEGAIFAGGPQSPPASTSASLTEVPTYGTVISTDGSSYVAPVATYPVETIPSASESSAYSTGSAPIETIPSIVDTSAYPTGTAPLETIPSVVPGPATTPLPHPIINGTYATGGAPATGNLSTTLGSATTHSGTSAQSTVLLTTVNSAGEPTTSTRIVAATPSDAGGAGASGSPSAGTTEGTTQPGAGNKVQAGAAAALAALAAVGAFLL